MVLKPAQFNQVCKCMAYIENLIMQTEWKIDAEDFLDSAKAPPTETLWHVLRPVVLF